MQLADETPPAGQINKHEQSAYMPVERTHPILESPVSAPLLYPPHPRS